MSLLLYLPPVPSKACSGCCLRTYLATHLPYILLLPAHTHTFIFDYCRVRFNWFDIQGGRKDKYTCTYPDHTISKSLQSNLPRGRGARCFPNPDQPTRSHHAYSYTFFQPDRPPGARSTDRQGKTRKPAHYEVSSSQFFDHHPPCLFRPSLVQISYCGGSFRV